MDASVAGTVGVGARRAGRFGTPLHEVRINAIRSKQFRLSLAEAKSFRFIVSPLK